MILYGITRHVRRTGLNLMMAGHPGMEQYRWVPRARVRAWPERALRPLWGSKG